MKMKHVTAALLAVMLIAFAGCGSGPKAGSTDELDATIREAADYLNTRIPAGSKAAFINISGGYPDLSDYILSDLSKHAVNDGVFSVVDRAQLDAVRAELNFNLSGEVDDNSAQAIGKMLGAQTIVSGSVRKIGALFRLDIRAIEVQTAQVQGQWNKNIPNGATIAALTANTAPGAAAAGGRTSGATASGGTAAASTRPAAPKNGTYTFWPRPRAKQNGIPVNAYLVKIVVDGRYMLVYLTDVERGIRGNPAGSGWGNNTGILTNLDRPSQSWKPSSYRWADNTNGEGYLYSFEGVTATRFSLECEYCKTVFEEIILDEPDE